MSVEEYMLGKVGSEKGPVSFLLSGLPHYFPRSGILASYRNNLVSIPRDNQICFKHCLNQNLNSKKGAKLAAYLMLSFFSEPAGHDL